MSGIELIGTLERIKKVDIPREERLRSIVRLREFDPTVIEPNIKTILLTLTELAKRVEAGDSKEIEFFGVMLIQLSKLLQTIPKHIKKIFDIIKLIIKNFPSVTKGFGLVSILTSLKYIFGIEYEVVFDETVKEIIENILLKSDSLSLRLKALETLFIALWNVPWALNEYMNVLKQIMETSGNPLFEKLFEYLSIIGKKNFYTIRPILDALLERYTDPLYMPVPVLLFLTNITIPIRETDYLEKMKDILRIVILRHKDKRVRSFAIVNFANIFKHPRFVEEKKILIGLIDTLTSIEEDIDLIIACLRALSICIWKDIKPPDELIERLASFYHSITDIDKKKTFIDTLLQVYSNIPEAASVIINFAIEAISTKSENIEILWELQRMLASIVASEIRTDTLYTLTQGILRLLKQPESQLSVSIRIMFIENVLSPIARRAPRIILDFADDILEAYRTAPSVSVFDDLAKVIYETLKGYPEKNDASIKLLKLLFNPPEIEATYELILKYLIGLSKKYQREIAENSDLIVDIFRTIKEIEVTLTDPKERYFAVDEAIKNLARLIVLILPEISAEDYDTFAKVLAAMYATEHGGAIRDILYAIIRAKDYPELFNSIINYLSKMTLSDVHKEYLKRIGVNI